MKAWCSWFLAFLLAVMASMPRAANASRAMPRKSLAPGLSLSLSTGNVRADTFLGASKATAFVFVGVHCPIANAKSPDIVGLHRRHRRSGARVVLVYSNPADFPDAASHARRYGLSELPRVLDRRQQLAKELGINMTPSAVVVDGKGLVTYFGRIDDSHVGRAKPKGSPVAHRDLENNLERTLRGDRRYVANKPVGCVLESSVREDVKGIPTYAGGVAAVLNRHCVPCHRQGEIGPMPLDSWTSARRFADNIESVVSDATMPPWKPVGKHGVFVGERRLSSADRDLLLRWARGGAPSGDLALAPSKPRFASGWTLGKPDLVLRMPKPWQVPASGSDDYRCFVLPTGLTEDKEVVAVEYRAGNKTVVHHVLGFVDTAGEGRRRDAADPAPGYTSFGGPGFLPSGEMGGWAPGNLPQYLPEGIARPLPAGSDLIIQVHYHPVGRVQSDVTEVGLYFAKKPTRYKLRVLPLIANVDIPAGESAYLTASQYRLPMDATAIFVVPHMHLLGREIRVDATLPSGEPTPLVRIDDWDFNWQDTYTFSSPLKLPRGTQLKLEARFDNSSGNPRQPSPTAKRVTWGEATTDEMCVAFVGYIVENEDDPAVKALDLLFGGRSRFKAR